MQARRSSLREGRDLDAAETNTDAAPDNRGASVRQIQPEDPPGLRRVLQPLQVDLGPASESVPENGKCLALTRVDEAVNTLIQHRPGPKLLATAEGVDLDLLQLPVRADRLTERRRDLGHQAPGLHLESRLETLHEVV